MTSPFPSGSRTSRKAPQARVSHIFKPRLPLDPIVEKHVPWRLTLDSVISATNAQSRRDVFLVLGAPTYRDMEPLLQSAHLSSSLLIIASHDPPHIIPPPHGAHEGKFPTIRILRLKSSLAVEDAGAVRLVNVLETAERVARLWRRSGGEGIEELNMAEQNENGTATDGGLNNLAPPSIFRFASSSSSGSIRSHNGSLTSSPQSSSENLPSSPNTHSRLQRLRSMSLPKIRSSPVRLPPSDSSQRPFDCILNFLPSDASVPEKSLLKQSILVTTISRPFLTAASNPSSSSTRSQSRSSTRPTTPGGTGDFKRWSGFMNRAPMYSEPATPTNRSRSSIFSFTAQGDGSMIFNNTTSPSPTLPPRKAHLVHLVQPPTGRMLGGIMANRKQLMDSMESFLCSFAYSSPDMNDFNMGMGSGMGMGMGMERVTPFLMYAHTLGSKVRHGDNEEGVAEEWTIADLIISGALDRSSPSGKERELGQQRAWIASANDFIFVPSSRPTSVILAPEPSAASISRERRKGSDGSEGSGGHTGIFTPPESVNLYQGTPSVTPPTPIFQHQRSPPAWSGSLLYREPILTVVGKGDEGMETKVLPLTPSDSGSDSSAASLRPRQPGNGAKRMSIALTIPKFGGGVSGDKNLKMKMSMSSGRWRFWKGAGISAAST